ncbi:unnamed protein product, partial [Meganyctiphanes norvegica]
FARTLPPATKIVKALISLLKEFRWSQFVLLSEKTKNFAQVAQAVKIFASHHDLKILDEFTVPHNLTSRNYDIVWNFILHTFKKTRIYVILAPVEVQWDFILTLRNFVNLEDYAIIAIDDDKFNGDTEMQPMRVPSQLANKVITHSHLQAFRAVLKITPTYPTDAQYKYFENRVKRRITQKPFCLPYHKELFPHIEVPIHAAHLYDAVMIYAMALNETLNDKTKDPRNGTHIISLMKQRSFPSIQGFKVYMDENGDAEGSYSLLAIKEVAGNLSGRHGVISNYSWHKVGQFGFHETPPGTLDMDNVPTLTLVDSIMWLGGEAPQDAPPCGFDGCSPDWKIIFSAIGAALAVVVAVLFVARHYWYEHKLACLLWKIDMKDVKIINSEMPSAMLGNTVQVCRGSLVFGGGTTSGEGGQSETPWFAYCNIGLFKGNIIAIKTVKKKSVDLTRNIRMELKQIRDVRHENLLSFIGASVDSGSVCILTTYCARGSLEDVLNNDDLSLDSMFVASLVADLIKGMIYLHDSEIISHGRLRSTNCLVDSRWVLLVSDFGLHDFKAEQEVMVEPQKKLWWAPELLRIPHHSRGTQKGDVFSFAIILYEVMGGVGPWGQLQIEYYTH